MDIPQQIREIESRATAAGVTMAQVLRRADVNHSTWWRWRHERSQPLLTTIQAVTAALAEIEAAAK